MSLMASLSAALEGLMDEFIYDSVACEGIFIIAGYLQRQNWTPSMVSYFQGGCKAVIKSCSGLKIN